VIINFYKGLNKKVSSSLDNLQDKVLYIPIYFNQGFLGKALQVSLGNNGYLNKISVKKVVGH